MFLYSILNATTVQISRQTSGTSRTATSTDTIAANTWTFICASYDGAGSIPKLYISSGTGINTVVAEVSYGTTSAGTGTDNAGPPTAIVIGNSVAFDREFKGRIAESWLFGSVLTTTEMTNLSRGYPIGTSLNYVRISGDATPELDTSGKGNSFDVTGTTKVAHAPIAPSFGWWN
jgi:hypothetical protein